MNKTKLLLLALCAIALTGCTQAQSKSTRLNDPFIDTRYYNGHTYIVFKYNSAGGITHDPDCQCREKGGKP